MDKGQRQETEDEGEGEEVFVLENKGLPRDREGTDVAHRKMAVYKDIRGNPMLG